MKHIQLQLTLFIFAIILYSTSINAQVAVCYNHLTTSLNVTGELQLWPQDFDDGSYDYVTLSISQTYFTCADIGTQEIILTATAANGNINTCTSLLTIQDKLAPIAICDVDVTVTADSNGIAIIDPALLDDGSYDNCSSITMTVIPAQISCVDGPIQFVTLTVEDASGNVNSCYVEVTLNSGPGGGNTSPTIACHQNLNVEVPVNDSVTLYAEDIIYSGPNTCNYIYVLQLLDTSNNVVPNNIVTDAYIGQSLTSIVTHPASGNNCWGFVTVVADTCPTIYVCDINAWDTPFGDCSTGHTDTDDVEWPADITVNDCYYSPGYLSQLPEVHPSNVRPILTRNCLYVNTFYTDVSFIYSPNSIRVLRTWTIVDWATGPPPLNITIYQYNQELIVNFDSCSSPVSIVNDKSIPTKDVAVNSFQSTNENGTAIITDLKNNTITPVRNDNLYNGVNILDAAQLAKHINSQIVLTDEEQFAADINEDDKLDSRDLFLLFKIAKRIIPNETSEDFWSFYNAEEIFDLDSLPSHFVQLGDANSHAAKFTSIKKGDLTGDADNNQQHSNLNYEEIKLKVEDEILNRGETYTVDFRMSDADNTIAQQIDLVFDLDIINIQGISSQLIPNFEDNFKLTAEGELSITWLDINQEINNPNNLPLFQVNMLAVQNNILNKSISIPTDNTNAMAKNFDPNNYFIVLEWENKILSAVDPTEYDRTLSIYPNPADAYSIISVSQEYRESYDLIIYDINGKLISQDRFSENVKVNTSSLKDGLYLFSINGESGFRGTGKIVIQH